MNTSKKIAIALIAGVILIAVFSILPRSNKESDLSHDNLKKGGDEARKNRPQAIPEETKGALSQVDIEDKLGRQFSKEEVELKPPNVPWHAWGFSIEAHRIAAEKNGDFKFFGKVISENGEPLDRVSLKVKVEASETSFAKALMTGDETSVQTIELVTDESGMFQIQEFGRRLTVTGFEKPGYTILGEKKFKGMAPKKSWSYSFIANSPSSFQPDPENPVIFTMKKAE